MFPYVFVKFPCSPLLYLGQLLVGKQAPLPGTDGLVYLVENIKGEGGWIDALSFLVRQAAVRQGLVHQLFRFSCSHR
jgi:hypothetical protein